MTELTRKIIKLQVDKGMKNIELAKLAEIPNSTLADILKGKTERISVRNLKSLADALDCTVDFLLDDRQATPCSARNSISDKQLSHDDAELLALYRQLDQRGRDLLLAVAQQQLDYQENDQKAAFQVADEEWRRFVGTVTAARGGVKRVDEREAKEMAIIKRAFLEE